MTTYEQFDKCPVDPFAKVMFPSLLKCANEISEGRYSEAQVILQSFVEKCKGLFSSMFYSKDDAVENNMRKCVDGIEKAYKRGCYGFERSLKIVITDFLLEQFSLEYRSMLSKLGDACKLMQLVDTSVCEVFFERRLEGLVLKDSRVEWLDDNVKGKNRKMFPKFILCAAEASEKEYTSAANILLSLQLDCQGFLENSLMYSSMKETVDHLRSQVEGVERKVLEMCGVKCQVVKDAVKETLLNEFYEEYRYVLKKLILACELMLIMNSMGYHMFFDSSSDGLILLNKFFIDDNIEPTPVSNFWMF